MADPKVSVIVPICNVEDYLRPCIESALDQTLADLEIILMDDGSKDSSSDIIDEYAAKDSRVVAIHKPNEGYGKSCNRGFDMAHGEYVAVLESDDFLELDMYERLYDYATVLEADVVKSPYRDCFYDGTMKPYPHNDFLTKHIPQGELYSLKTCPWQLATHQSIWAGIYKRSYMNDHNIRFDEVPGAGHVDIKFAVESVVYSDRLAWYDTMFYNYRVLRKESSTANYSIAENVERYRQMQDFFLGFPEEFRASAPAIVAREGGGCYRYFRSAPFTDADFKMFASLMNDFTDYDIQQAPLLRDSMRRELLRMKTHPNEILHWLRYEQAEKEGNKAAAFAHKAQSALFRRM